MTTLRLLVGLNLALYPFFFFYLLTDRSEVCPTMHVDILHLQRMLSQTLYVRVPVSTAGSIGRHCLQVSETTSVRIRRHVIIILFMLYPLLSMNDVFYYSFFLLDPNSLHFFPQILLQVIYSYENTNVNLVYSEWHFHTVSATRDYLLHRRIRLRYTSFLKSLTSLLRTVSIIIISFVDEYLGSSNISEKLFAGFLRQETITAGLSFQIFLRQLCSLKCVRYFCSSNIAVPTSSDLKVSFWNFLFRFVLKQCPWIYHYKQVHSGKTIRYWKM